jgi:hypothetical protein
MRFDGLAGVAHPGSSRLGEPLYKTAMARFIPEGYSGRRFVVLAICTIAAIWGVTYLVFTSWRAGYRARAAFGATQVVPAIDPLASVIPPEVDPNAWRDAVERTHDMLLTVTSSNLLGLEQMRQLRAELEQAVARAGARPETARDELATIWNRIEERGGFLLKDERSEQGTRHPRPKLLPPPPKKPERATKTRAPAPTPNT